MIDFSKWLCRASQSSKMMTGKIGISDNQESELQGYIDKMAIGKLLTSRQEGLYNDLTKKKTNRELPRTITSFLRKEHREIKYDRIFLFTNKYLQKGLLQEDESITLLSNFLNIPLFKNEERRENELFTGLPDLPPKALDYGVDVKSSWELATFPFADDPLDFVYESQNQVYMNLWGCNKWVTAYCLVNATEQMVYNEKQKFFYALGQPDLEDYIYVGICKEIEKKMIFDKAKFDKDYPLFNWDNTEWNFDIPESERVVMFESNKDDSFIDQLGERVIIGRKYLSSL